MHLTREAVLLSLAIVAVIAFFIGSFWNRSPMLLSLWLVAALAALSSLVVLLTEGPAAAVTAGPMFLAIAAFFLFPALIGSGLAQLVRSRLGSDRRP